MSAKDKIATAAVTIYHNPRCSNSRAALALLQEKGVKRIDESPIELLVSTDTVDCPAVANSIKIRIIPAAPLFAEAVRAVRDRVSVSNLFEYTPGRMLDTSFARQMSLKDMR